MAGPLQKGLFSGFPYKTFPLYSQWMETVPVNDRARSICFVQKEKPKSESKNVPNRNGPNVHFFDRFYGFGLKVSQNLQQL